MDHADLLNIQELQSDQDVLTWYQTQIHCKNRVRQHYQRWQQILEHTCLCIDTLCLPECNFMKRIFFHARNCLVILHGTCAICKMLITQTYFHAPRCTNSNCSIPYCSNVKLKFEKHQKLRLNYGDLQERHPDIIKTASVDILENSNVSDQASANPLLTDYLKLLETDYELTAIPFPSSDFFRHIHEVQEAYPRISTLSETINDIDFDLSTRLGASRMLPF